MQISKLMMVNAALMCALVLTDTGCKNADGTWRWPWSKDRSVLGTGDGVNDVGGGNFGNTDLNQITDENGNLISGARFEDVLQPVIDIRFNPVYFGFDSYSIPPQEMSKIEAVAQDLLQNNSHVLVVEGHCDERGSNEYNLSLGENRAQTIRSILVNHGIAADRIQTRSYGEEKPAVVGSGEEAWRLNRRGEFALYQR